MFYLPSLPDLGHMPIAGMSVIPLKEMEQLYADDDVPPSSECLVTVI
jgi:hypothetical protein